jgi:MYXO-CTERM domain-containing protein
LFPYGCREQNAANHDELEALALAIGESIMGVHDEDYTVVKGASWYPACGVAPDWFFDEFGAASFTIELRPTDWDEGGGMSPPPDQIIPTCEEVMAGVLRLGAELTGGGNGTDTGTDSSGDGSTGTETGTGGTTGTGTGSGTDDGGTGDDGGGDDGTGDDGGGDDGTGATDTDGDGSGTEDGTEEGEGSGSGDGCGCTTRGAGGLALAPFALVLAAFTRRRRQTGRG